MTDLSSRAFAFSEKCGRLASLSWGSGNKSVRSGLSQLPITKLSWTYAAFILTCRRGHVTRIAVLLANCSLLAILMLLQMDGEATLFPPSSPSHLHFLSSELQSQAVLARSLACLPLAFSFGTGSFPCIHGLRLQQTVPRTSCSAHSFLFCRAWDGTEGLMCAKQLTALLPSHTPDSHLLVLAPRRCLNVYDCSASFSEKPSLLASQASPYLLSSFHCTFSD